METEAKTKTGPKDLNRRGTPLQGDPYEKFFSRRLEALVHHQGAQLQPANLFLKLQPKTGTNQWLETCPG
jgi:hypothetical protein